MEHLKFPIGRFEAPAEITEKHIEAWIDTLETFPSDLRMAAENLSHSELNTAYRPGGWTARQVIHHLADSHMNSYIRFKLAVTEENPTIRPYFEDKWAECEEAKNADIPLSLNLIEALHLRWVLFLRSLKKEDWERTFYHPESKKNNPLKTVVGLYAWHGKHHLAHVLLCASS
jgi:hypothetical protein